jgi:hypothetical protein
MIAVSTAAANSAAAADHNPRHVSRSLLLFCVRVAAAERQNVRPRVREPMTEDGIVEAMSGHSARNVELIRLIRSKGADLDVVRRIDLHFFAPSETSASKLAKSLGEAGLLNVFHAPSSSSKWNVEGQVEQSVTAVVQPSFVEWHVRVAAEHGATFDGWGTSL